MVTAIHEHYGGSLLLDLDVAGDIDAPLNTGVGGKRLLAFYSDTPNRTVRLPDARRMRTGEAYVIYNHATSTETIDVVDNTTAVIVKTVDPGDACEIYLFDNSTQAGQWFENTAAAELLNAFGTSGGGIVRPGAFSYTFNLNGVQSLPKIATILDGWDGVSPVALHFRVFDDSVSQHTDASSLAALDLSEPLGGWPSDSYATLIVWGRGIVTGRGGQGGRGASTGLLPLPGYAGTAAIYTDLPMSITNHGTIQGGGGGGGGGSTGALGTAGGGGGGGAGGLPGDGGPRGGVGALSGNPGSLSMGGSGGRSNGPLGAPHAPEGGPPGLAGGAGGGGPGAGGASIDRASGVTVTKHVVGTIVGAEVTH